MYNQNYFQQNLNFRTRRLPNVIDADRFMHQGQNAANKNLAKRDAYEDVDSDKYCSKKDRALLMCAPTNIFRHIKYKLPSVKRRQNL